MWEDVREGGGGEGNMSDGREGKGKGRKEEGDKNVFGLKGERDVDGNKGEVQSVVINKVIKVLLLNLNYIPRGSFFSVLC